MNAPGWAEGSVLGDVPPFAGDRIEPDPHPHAASSGPRSAPRSGGTAGRGWSGRLAATGPVRRRLPLGLGRAVARALDDRADDQGEPDEQRAQTLGRAMACRPATRPRTVSARTETTRTRRRAPVPARHAIRPSSGPGAGASRRPRRRPPCRTRRSRTSCPDSSDESKRIETIGVRPDHRGVADEPVERLAAGVLEQARVLVDLAAAQGAQAGHDVAAEPRLRTTSPKTMPFGPRCDGRRGRGS